MEKLCVYFGSFNPVHKGHLKIAELVKKHFEFEKILFIPAYRPPHKNFDPKMSLHRLKMLELAAGKQNVSDIEFKREAPSYTYATAKELYRQLGFEEELIKKGEIPAQDKINFIIGYDAFKNIEKWYEAEKLPKLLNFIVIPRDRQTDFSHMQKKGYNFKILNTDFIDVSSEKIRNLIKNGCNADKFLDEKVKDYIKKHGLYT